MQHWHRDCTHRQWAHGTRHTHDIAVSGWIELRLADHCVVLTYAARFLVGLALRPTLPVVVFVALKTVVQSCLNASVAPHLRAAMLRLTRAYTMEETVMSAKAATLAHRQQVRGCSLHRLPAAQRLCVQGSSWG